MKFKDWKLDSLIEYLQLVRHSSDLDWRHIIRVSGEIHCVNGERKDGQPEDQPEDVIWGIK